MNFSVTYQSLSALTPVWLSYNFKNEEALKYTARKFDNSLLYYQYNIFNNLQDISISKKNLLCLTDAVSLSDCFEYTIVQENINEIGNSFYISLSNGNTVQLSNANNADLYAGPPLINYSPMLISVLPNGDGTVELHVENNTILQVSENYPFLVYASKADLPKHKQNRQSFILEYSKESNLIAIKTLTNQGYRYLCANSSDNFIRATGVRLGNLAINDYLFTPTFVASPVYNLDYNPSYNEVQYYNDYNLTPDSFSLNVKNKHLANTNLLVSCPTTEILNTKEGSINAAYLKTNFTSSETYIPLN